MEALRAPEFISVYWRLTGNSSPLCFAASPCSVCIVARCLFSARAFRTAMVASLLPATELRNLSPWLSTNHYAEQMPHGATLLAILVLIAAAYSYYWYSPAPPLPALSAKVRRNAVRVGARDRTCLVYVPANLPQQAALVIVLHGSGMDGARMRISTGYEFDCLADQHGFVVLYPDGYRRNWNDCRKNATFPSKRQNIDDVNFMRALIARMMLGHAIDQKRVYVFGYSNGAHMAFRLAMEAPAEIAAIASVAANLPTPDASSCPATGSNTARHANQWNSRPN